jgi:hypothetical protein
MPRLRREKARGLPLDFPGREELSLPNDMQLGGELAEFTCATVYANVKPNNTGNFARINLFGGSLGQRSLIASAFVGQGFQGPCIVASGFAVDGWHVLVQATGPGLELDLVLQAEGCCAEPSVLVPRELQQPPAGLGDGNLIAAIAAANPAPFQTETGLWQLVTDATPGVPPYTVPRGIRVAGIAVIASQLVDGTLTITTPIGVQPVITVPAGGTFRVRPSGNSLVGPATINWANMARVVIELVR